MLAELLSTLRIKHLPEVEILTNDETEITVGRKRQLLLEKAKGEYVAFIDDDDEVSDMYLSEIIVAIRKEPDVIGFDGFMTTNGKEQRTYFKISKDLPYKGIVENGRTVYLRHNNHLSPIKREIALKIGYRDIRHGEDYDYAMRLKQSGLVKTEIYIERNMYHYKYIHEKNSDSKLFYDPVQRRAR